MPVTQKKYLDESGAQDIIDQVERRSPATFVGTTAEWNALTAAQKAKYLLVNLTDDCQNTIEPTQQVITFDDDVVVDGVNYGHLRVVRVAPYVRALYWNGNTNVRNEPITKSIGNINHVKQMGTTPIEMGAGFQPKVYAIENTNSVVIYSGVQFGMVSFTFVSDQP